MPLVLMIFGRLGLVSPAWLRKHRRYSIMAIFIVATILAPPDPFTQVIMATVLMALYEFSIILVARVYPKERLGDGG